MQKKNFQISHFPGSQGSPKSPYKGHIRALLYVYQCRLYGGVMILCVVLDVVCWVLLFCEQKTVEFMKIVGQLEKCFNFRVFSIGKLEIFIWKTLQKLGQKGTQRFLIVLGDLYHLPKVPLKISTNFGDNREKPKNLRLSVSHFSLFYQNLSSQNFFGKFIFPVFYISQST